jgi:hypothetical protein
MDQPQKPTESTAPAPESKLPSNRWAILRQRDFWFGVGIFVLMNAVFVGLAIALSRTRIAFYGGGSLISAIAMLANVLMPALLYKRRQIMVRGMLYTLAFLLIAGAVCIPVFIIGTCFSQMN